MDYLQEQSVNDDSAIQREVDKEITQARMALVKRVQADVQDAKKHFKKTFDRMRSDMKFVRGKQWDGGDENSYVANLTLRHVNQRVASIYAKNPTATAVRKKRLSFEIWDGSQDSLQQALMTAQQSIAAGMELPPEVAALLADIERGKNEKAMLDKIGKTLEIVFKHSLDEPMPRFKAQAKQLIRRVVTTGVGFIKLGYQRAMQKRPEVISQIQDHTDKLAQLEMLSDDLAEGIISQDKAEMEELRLGLAELQKIPELVVREGLVFDFPKSTQVIVDRDCVQLQGFVGAKWIAHEMIMTKDQIKKVYKVDVGDSFTSYSKSGTQQKAGKKDDSYCLVWEFYDLVQQAVYTVCDGYADFLKEGAPDIDIEQFHPFFVLTFNDVETEDDIYPPSDVELMRPMQQEHNRSRQGLREHRISNTPAWVTAKGVFEADDKDKMANHAVNELLELSIDRTTDVRTVLQPKPNNPIDPAVYDTSYLFEDIQRALGSQEADFGGTSGATATEASISENTRVSSVQSNIDDLDEFLTNVSRAAGQVLLLEMDIETVKKIAGVGAVWPKYTSKEVAEELTLEIKAGSSGRPNRALRIANLERVAPFILQTPNLNPEWFLKQLIVNLDDDIDMEDAILSGMPSIISMNGNSQLSTGDPSTDPNAQGSKGGDNKEKAGQTQGGAQPAFPTPQA